METLLSFVFDVRIFFIFICPAKLAHVPIIFIHSTYRIIYVYYVVKYVRAYCINNISISYQSHRVPSNRQYIYVVCVRVRIDLQYACMSK